jgi:hypothetical protein
VGEMSTPLRLSTFADRFPAEMVERVEKLAESLQAKVAAKLEDLVDEPVSTGGLRSSRSLVTSKKGLRLGWTAPGAIGVDVGRIQSKTYQRKLKSGKKSRPYSRMLGSEKKKEGFTQPAIAGLRLAWDQVASEAGQEFNR